MTNITKVTGREVVVSCLSGVSVLRGTGVSGAAEARLAERGLLAGAERPKAPAAVVAAEASAYAVAAKGADLQQTWTGGNFAGGAMSAAEHLTIRAFRGLEPWRDPA
ncbi:MULTISPECIES: hypothetical protein [unclassified Streptomyces]|uniref:hypothetical protein n=1 Tax=unclassified Streptomyces TaxID=2593676 RepID=UPI000BF7E3CE|nr:hypothetical protein [Streptomyces sp. Ru87]PGH52362.1 hypothetical protein CRI70_01780 [Streptomyces sp. Ru87]